MNSLLCAGCRGPADKTTPPPHSQPHPLILHHGLRCHELGYSTKRAAPAPTLPLGVLDPTFPFPGLRHTPGKTTYANCSNLGRSRRKDLPDSFFALFLIPPAPTKAAQAESVSKVLESVRRIGGNLFKRQRHNDGQGWDGQNATLLEEDSK